MSQFIEMSGDWGRHKLDSFIDIVRGVSYKPTDVVDSNNPCATGILRANNISDGELNTVEMVYVNNERVSEIQKLRPKDIVMCASSGSQYLVGKAAINKHLHSNYAHGAFCLLIRCKELLMPEFLNLYLQTDDYRGQIEEKSCGSNILNIKQSDITSLIIPIPNFAVQQNFVTILKQADKSKFIGFKSQFIEMFGEEQKISLGKICLIQKGATITRNEVTIGSIPVVAGGQEPSCYHNEANRNANMITISASGAYAGYVNYWEIPIFASDCNTISPKDTKQLDIIFLYNGLKAMQKEIYSLQKGGAQPHVYGKDLHNLLFPFPPFEHQQEFSDIVKQADKSKYIN